MKTFNVIINGEEEKICAKHIANGIYLVRQLRTGNLNRIKYIETLHGNNGQKTYRIKSFYPASRFFNTSRLDHTVTLIENYQE